MKPLLHPAIEDVTVEGVLHALSDPTRVQILKEIIRANSPKTCSAFLRMPDRILPKSTLSQHIRILREAGLIRSERKGTQLHNTPRCAELKSRFGEMIGAILTAYAEQGGGAGEEKETGDRG